MASDRNTLLTDEQRGRLKRLINEGLQFVDAEEDILCSSCQMVPIFHYTFPCQHPYCGDCYHLFLETNKKCRNCKSDIGSQPIRNEELDRRINDLKVICPNQSDACQEQMKLGELLQHLDKCLPPALRVPQPSWPVEVNRIGERAERNDPITVSSPMAANELPVIATPPAESGGIWAITCNVCLATLDVNPKIHRQLVRCSECKEDTPLAPPPYGKKYVRCPCKGLLMCNATARRVVCPRFTCRRSLHLPPDAVRYRCAHCVRPFPLLPPAYLNLRCPTCRKKSTVGSARALMIEGIVVGVASLTVGAAVLAGTRGWVRHPAVMSVAYVGNLLLGGSMLLMGLDCGLTRVSQLERRVENAVDTPFRVTKVIDEQISSEIL